ncbi:YcaO-like family protein [Glacieibacterium megasporae]|uniref:YcaO-like family protein n=1 Tax=Glacieibacterium megasporae TaxID=2835787 RepID=UPI001C1E69DC|nr:YcaO-like family protein [Polymorphobacter megasporae]UAJ12292.1 YcaO-like family protein [Polymorphobacter megasporae]
MARQAAAVAGVSRLADVSGLVPLGIPVYQAVRPMARLLSVSQGKGLSRMAAMVSALLEAVEIDTAERLGAPPATAALDALDDATIDLWSSAPRRAYGTRLDPSLPRAWLEGRDLLSDRRALLPWDLLSLDICRPILPDIRPASVGLATGNNIIEATVGAVGELVEHDLHAALRHLAPREMRACQLDLASVDDPICAALLRRIVSRRFSLRIWSMGQDANIAAFRCTISEALPTGACLPPTAGTGCHPDRTIALIRAVLEAVQSRVTMVAGSREDLTIAHYLNGPEKSLQLVFGTLAFGPGPLAWSDIPHRATGGAAEDLDHLLAVAASRSTLPLVLYTHTPPHPDLVIVHALAPGLEDLERQASDGVSETLQRGRRPARVRIRSHRPLLFIGPSLPPEGVPDTIEVRPPLSCGDIAALLVDPPPAVGIVDGCFETAPTVWHKEILDLIALGVPVLGGASLGAIRAAELDRHGMIGVGTIYAAYRDRMIQRDDAVMLSHGPAEIGYPHLTIALVDAEAALLELDLPSKERRQLQRIIRTMSFAERSWSRCFDVFHARTRQPVSIDRAVLTTIPSLKQADARLLIAELGDARRHAARPRPPLTGLYADLLATLR